MIEKLNKAVIEANVQFAKMHNAPCLSVDPNPEGGYIIYNRATIIAHAPTLEAVIALVSNAPVMYIWGYTDAVVDLNR